MQFWFWDLDLAPSINRCFNVFECVGVQRAVGSGLMRTDKPVDWNAIGQVLSFVISDGWSSHLMAVHNFPSVCHSCLYLTLLVITKIFLFL